MKSIHVVRLATMFLLSTFGSAQQNAPATATKASAPPPSTVTGSGTANYVPLWTSGTALGISHIYQGSSGTGIGTTSPQYALDVDGHINAGGYLIGESLVLTVPQGVNSGNLALGFQTLLSNSSGTVNTAIGQDALRSNTGGVGNTALGNGALLRNVVGNENTASGFDALTYSTGYTNTAIGAYALLNNATGSSNTAIGWDVLGNNTSGVNNIAIGYEAGYEVAGGNSENIHIGNMGTSTDSGTIRIGTSGPQSSFFAAGIYGVSSGSSSAIPVLVDSSGQLVTVSSSRRFKEDIHDMGDASSDLMRLRPVTFHYKKPLADGSQPMQYGLIAEEVAEVYPDLVAYCADGQIETVKYQLLDPMLLNEVQRQQAEIRELQERLNKIESALAETIPGTQTK